jgi:hypothetical protein
MPARGYELDHAVTRITDRVRRLELAVARRRLTAASDVTFDNSTSDLPAFDVQEAIEALIVTSQWKDPVAAASIGPGTLATAYENGDTIDGVVLATADRILLKDQAAGEENGIYVVQASGAPLRAVDIDEDDEVVGAIVYVVAGTANAGKTFRNTNTEVPHLGTTPLTFVELSSPTAIATPITVEDEGIPLATAVDTLDFVGAGVTASGIGATKTITIPGGVTDHGALTGLADDDHSAYETVTGGGGPTVQDHGNMGATETVDAANGNQHRGTLDADCTITVAAFADGGIIFKVEQDGTGSWGITWSGVIFEAGTDEQPAQGPGDVTFYTFISDDGTVYAFKAGGGSGGAGIPASSVASETMFGITPAVGTGTDYARDDHTHGSPDDPVTAINIGALGFVGPLLISDTPSTPLVFADLIQNEAQTDLVYADL